MRIAIPVENDRLSAHFGHCEEFAFLTVDDATCEVVNDVRLPAPPHQPGFLPGWLAEQGAEVIIAGGMGPRAVDLMAHHGIRVVLGAPLGDPTVLAMSFAKGELADGESTCDHGPDHQGCGDHGQDHGHGGGCGHSR